MTDKQAMAAPTSTARSAFSRLSADRIPALPIETSKAFRFLAIFDPFSDAWKGTLAPIFAAFRQSDPVAIILRIESPSVPRVNLAVERITAFLGELGKKVDEAIDIVLEATPLTIDRRGALYAAAHAFVPGRTPETDRFEREARAYSLPVVTNDTPESLRAMVSSLLETGKVSAATAFTLYEDPNRYARPPSIELGSPTRVHGYQEFTLSETEVTPLPIDAPLETKRGLVQRYFEPSFMKGKTLLDIGANAGFFSFWALHSGAAGAVALDMDERYINLVTLAAKHHHIAGIRPCLVKAQDWEEPADLVLAFAMIHWLYSCTAAYGSLDAVIDKLADLTRHTLIVEWIDPADKAMREFKHTEFNPSVVAGPYTLEAFENALIRRFGRVEILGETTPTRVVYAAHRDINEVSDLSDLPLVAPADRVMAARTLCEYESVTYQSRVYRGEQPGTVLKQTTGDLAAREANVMRRLRSRHFPRVIEQRSAGGSSEAVFELVEGRHLRQVLGEIARTPAVFARFVDECLSILGRLRDAKVRHRDIQAQNILVRDGSPVLIDFGWAEVDGESFMTPPGLGARGRPADQTFCDVYSMGKTLEEVLPRDTALFAPLLVAMTQPRREDRVTHPGSLKAILHGLELPAGWDVPLRFAIPPAPR
jgi:hypothetical protein